MFLTALEQVGENVPGQRTRAQTAWGAVSTGLHPQHFSILPTNQGPAGQENEVLRCTYQDQCRLWLG